MYYIRGFIHYIESNIPYFGNKFSDGLYLKGLIITESALTDSGGQFFGVRRTIHGQCICMVIIVKEVILLFLAFDGNVFLLQPYWPG